ncbi:hypothetical protein DZS_31850 [Dickeya ananatis]
MSVCFAVLIVLIYGLAMVVVNIPVILQVAGVLVALLGPSLGLALSGPQHAAFNSAPGRVVVHPNHLPE